jgi:hypothetical protein
MLAGIDFELTVDPQDPEKNLIYISNANNGGSIVAARVDGQTGMVITGSLTKIVNNFFGLSSIDGPEFVQKPSGELGVLYAGLGGVHGTFRSAVPAAWNDFRFDVNGLPFRGGPPLLTNTSEGAYPAPPLPLGQFTFGQWLGSCLGVCYGALGGSITTDVVAVLQERGLTVSTTAQSPRDGYIFISACNSIGSCGLYEAFVDPSLGILPQSFSKLASVSGPAAVDGLVAERHPVTGSTVLFSNEDEGGTIIDVWEQPGGGGALTLIGKFSVSASRRYRTAASDTQVVLHYIIRLGKRAGSYTLPVSATRTSLVPGSIQKVSDTGTGSELEWLPAADNWGLFYRRSPTTLTRCWITP